MSIQDPGFCSQLGGFVDPSTGLCTTSHDPGSIALDPGVLQPVYSTTSEPFQQSTSDNPGQTVVSGQTTVNVTNTVNVADQTLNNVASAVDNAVGTAANTASDIAKTTASEISHALGDVASAISNTITSATSTLWSWIQSIAGAIASVATNIFQTVSGALGTAATTIANSVKDVLTPIEGVVNSVATEVQQITDQYIIPISNTVNSFVTTIGTLTTAIEQDLKEGLSGIVNIPGQLANGLTTLDASLQRTLQQLPDALKTGVSQVLVGTATDSLGTPLVSIGESFTSVSGSDVRKTTFSDHVKLPEPGVLAASADALKALWAQIQNLFSSVLGHGQDNVNAIKAQLADVPFMLGDMVEIPTTLLLLAGSIVAELYPLYQYEIGQANGALGLAKLAPGDAIQAWLRQYIDDDTLTQELQVNGWDAQRIQVMKDLQIQLLDVATVLDMYFRGIVQEDDLRANLLQHGFAPPDQDALILQAYRVTDVQGAVKGWLYGTLSSDQLTASLKQNRFTDNEIQLFYSTVLRPENAAELIERKKRTTLWTSNLILDQSLLTAPPDVVQAAQNDALSPQVATDLWMTQFTVPPLEYWLQLYFRGVRTHTELMAAMDYYKVPAEWRDDFIQANSALIPYRTIPTMLAAGLITEAYAQQQLAAHGFPLQAQEALLKYAGIHKNTAAATSASDLKSISVATARTAWNDGALTDDQYAQVLEAHGFDAATVALTLQVEKMEQAIKTRQQTAQDIVNEAAVGFITVDQAKQQLNSDGYTQAEQAKYLKQIARAKGATAKLPSRTDLKDFWKAQIIQESDYQAGMTALGYSAQAVQWFTALDTPATQAVSSTSPTG